MLMPPVIGYGYFLESPNDAYVVSDECNAFLVLCDVSYF